MEDGWTILYQHMEPEGPTGGIRIAYVGMAICEDQVDELIGTCCVVSDLLRDARVLQVQV